MCIIYDTYFQWNENAGRMFRSFIPRTVPVYMPLVEWRDTGVPLGHVKVFNRFVADLCRANFSPWCAVCRCSIPSDCSGCIVIFPSKRVCPICKTDAFISDFRLWSQFNIGMKQLMPADAEASAKAAEASAEAAAKAAEAAAAKAAADEDEASGDEAKKRRVAPKKQRPPPKMKKPSRRLLRAPLHAPSGVAQGRRTVLQYIIEDCPEVYYFTQSGTKHQRVAFTSDPKDLDGHMMSQRLNMIFFLKRDIERVFDLKKAAEYKKLRDDAAAVIGGAIMRLTQVRDVKWALPW
jgi:hypothetical protein